MLSGGTNTGVMQLAGEISTIVAFGNSFKRGDIENIVALTVPLKGEAVRDGQFLVNEGESMKVSSTSF